MLFSHSSASLRSLRRAALASFALFLPAAVSAQTITSFAPTTATAGSTITITGTGLSTVKSVELNGLEMRVTGTATALSVSVIVPPAAATGKLRLTTTTGTVLSGRKLGISRQSSATSYGQLNTSVTSSTATGNFSTPTTADLDHDGLVEMIVGQGDGTLMWYEQTATNATTLSAGSLLQTSAGATIDVGYYAKPTVTDLDGDGLLDLLVGEENGTVIDYEQVAVSGANALKFTSTTLFTNPYGTTVHNSPNAGSYARPGVSDIDSNGLLDILVGANDGTIRRYEQLAANNKTTAGFKDFGTVKMSDGSVLDAGDVSKPLLTDYNGDGLLDLVVGTYGGTIQLYTQTASNVVTFQSLGNLSTAGTAATVINMGNSGTNALNMNGYGAPAVTDIDGDGLLDLFIGNGSGTVYRYEQAQSSTVPSLSAPLPVVLTSFTGQATSAGNQLSWATAQELKSASFVVEASADGSTFGPVAELAAAGTSSSPRSYQYLDASAAAQTASRRYYRLRQVDLDGTVVYSAVITLSRSTAATASKVEAYPNPFADQLSVALPGSYEPQATSVTLLTLAGRPVFETKLQLSAAPQALAGLPELTAGIYILRLTTASGSSSQKVVRQ